MTDHELDEVLRQVKTEFPNAGYRRVHSQLVSRGIRVSHLRVREAMHRCDPEGGQYKTWTADYGLRTTDYGLGIKHGLRYKTRTRHYGQGIKYGLGIKRGLSITDSV